VHHQTRNCLFIIHGSHLRDETRAAHAELLHNSFLDAFFASSYCAAHTTGNLKPPLRHTPVAECHCPELLLSDWVTAWAFGLLVEAKRNARASSWNRVQSLYRRRAWIQHQWHAVSRLDRAIPKRCLLRITRISSLRGRESSPNPPDLRQGIHHLQLIHGDR
jgi:hypothetical protein